MFRKVLFILLFFIAYNTLPVNETAPFSEVGYATSGVMVDDCIEDKKDEACKEDTKAAVDNEQESTAVGVSAWDYIKMIFALAFVVGLLYVVLRFLNNRNAKYQHSKMMQNLGGISVGSQKSVQLVKVGSSLYLVGVGEDDNMLKEITDEHERESLIALYSEKQMQPIQGTPFSGLFKNIAKKNKDAVEEDNIDFKTEFSNRLDQIKQQRNEELQELKQKERSSKDE